MTRVNSILKKINANREAQNAISKQCAEAIQELENKAMEESEAYPIPTSDAVLETLYEIAIGKRVDTPESHTVFDDPDIQWYLHKYGHCGPAHTQLRKEYERGMEEASKARGIVLPMFSFTPEEAKALIAEVDANYSSNKPEE